MSKYIETRKQKIKELSEQLNIVNERIDSYISFLENFKQSIKFDGHFVVFNLDLDYTKTQFYKNEEIVFKNFNIQLNIDNQHITIYLNEDFCSFHRIGLPLSILTVASTIILLINQKISFNNIKNDIKESELLYNKIVKINKEIDLEKSGFKEKYSLLIHSIKNYFPIQSNFDFDNGFLFNLKNNNSKRSISFREVKKIEEIKNGIYLKTPNLDNYYLEQINSNSSNTNDYFDQLDKKTILIKQDFCDLNKDFLNHIQLPIESIHIEIFLGKLNIKIENLTEKQLSIAVDKINSNIIISNF